MNGAHWSGQDCINHLYGIGPDPAHLKACGECRARVELCESARKESARAPEVSAEFLAAQRRNIYRRLGREPQKHMRFVPAFAAVLLVLVALFVGRTPWRTTPPPLTSAADSQLFSDIYSLEQSSEPQAVHTVQELFEEN